VQRLELVRIRVCKRCGRGNAELRGDGGAELVVRVDAARVRELQGAAAEEMRSLTDVLLEQLAAAGFEASEVVLDTLEGRLRGLVSLLRDEEVEVVGCTAEEAVTLAVRGSVRLFATDEAVAHAAPGRGDASGGPDTIH
jgi:hypothetical protein